MGVLLLTEIPEGCFWPFSVSRVSILCCQCENITSGFGTPFSPKSGRPTPSDVSHFQALCNMTGTSRMLSIDEIDMSSRVDFGNISDAGLRKNSISAKKTEMSTDCSEFRCIINNRQDCFAHLRFSVAGLTGRSVYHVASFFV